MIVRNKVALLAFSGVVVLLSGCASGPAVTPGPVPLEGASPITPNTLAPKTIQPNDVISLTVLREPDLTLPGIRIGEGGSFMMPLIGEVSVVGLTPTEVAALVRDRLAAEYLVNPQVAVNIVDYGSHMVTVEGAAAAPGMYQFTPGTTLLGAIALAGGPSINVARLNEIAIFRTIDGEPMVAVYDLKQVRAGLAADPAIMPGDRVVIGYSALGEGLENLLRAIPIANVFTRL